MTGSDFQIITTVCVAARLYVRYFVTRSPGWDDYFVIATYVSLALRAGVR